MMMKVAYVYRNKQGILHKIQIDYLLELKTTESVTERI
jgi:hypothetical protein